MLTRSTVAVLALAALAVPFAPDAGSQNSAGAAPLAGPVAGLLDLPPAGSGAVGTLDGALFSVDGSLPLYRFQAFLTDVPSPCLSCGTGDLNGTLDDGIGPGPDFIVRGPYGGFWIAGRYEAHIFRPGGTTAIGRIEGRYADPPGAFGGRFRIRR